VIRVDWIHKPFFGSHADPSCGLLRQREMARRKRQAEKVTSKINHGRKFAERFRHTRKRCRQPQDEVQCERTAREPASEWRKSSCENVEKSLRGVRAVATLFASQKIREISLRCQRLRACLCACLSFGCAPLPRGGWTTRHGGFVCKNCCVSRISRRSGLSAFSFASESADTGQESAYQISLHTGVIRLPRSWLQ
jgi:hypothetical protein